MQTETLPTPAPAIPDNRARTLAIVLGVAALAVMIGLFTKSWFTAPNDGGGVGLSGVEVCRGDRCQSADWSDLKGAPKDLGIFGTLGLLGGLASVGFTAFAAVMVLQGKVRTVPHKVMNIVLGLTAFCTTMFFMRVLGEMGKDLSIGYSGFLTVGGLLVIGGVVQKGLVPLGRPDRR